MKSRRLLSTLLALLLLLSVLPPSLAAPTEAEEAGHIYVLTEDGELAAVSASALPDPEAAYLMAAEITMGGLRYQLSGNTAAVTGYTDDMPAVLTIPAELDLDGTVYTVTVIGAQAFSGCTRLTAVTIPAGVSSIGALAFNSTPALASVTVADGNPAFSAADGVLFSGSALFKYPSARADTAYTVPDGTSVIAAGAFWGAVNLTEISFPDTLAEIQETAFTGCTGLRTLTLPESVAVVGSYAFQNCRFTAAVLNGTVMLGQGAFQNCTALETVSLPASLESLGSGCFSGCSALRDISAAAGCPACASVDGVLFNADLSRLLVYPNASENTVFTVPKNVTELDAGVFASAKSLEVLSVEAGSTAYSAADGVLFSADGAVLFAYPYAKAGGSYTVPDTVTEIGAKAFYQNPTLTEIVLNSGLQTIGSNAFASAKLQAVALPDTLETIGQSAFIRSALESVTIPAAVTSVGRQAFDYCSKLNDAEFLGSVPGKLTMVFSGCTSLRIVYVPAGTLSAWQTALINSLPVGAAVTEDRKPSPEAVMARIAALTESTGQSEVNALAADYLRLRASEKAAIPDDAIRALDDAVLRVDPILRARVNAADCTVSVSAAGLALASGETEGSAVLEVKESARETAVLDLTFSMAVNNTAAQPLGPVLITVTGTAAMAKLDMALYRVSGKTMTPVPFRQAGRSLIFRADSLGEYIFVDVTQRGMVFQSADYASVSSTGVETARLIAARYADGRMVEVLTPEASLNRDSRLVRLPWKTTENSSFRLFWLDENGVPVMEAAEYEE